MLCLSALNSRLVVEAVNSSIRDGCHLTRKIASDRGRLCLNEGIAHDGAVTDDGAVIGDYSIADNGAIGNDHSIAGNRAQSEKERTVTHGDATAKEDLIADDGAVAGNHAVTDNNAVSDNHAIANNRAIRNNYSIADDHAIADNRAVTDNRTVADDRTQRIDRLIFNNEASTFCSMLSQHDALRPGERIPRNHCLRNRQKNCVQ